MASWNVNRLILVLAGLLEAIALAMFLAAGTTPMEVLPFGLGLLAVLALLFFAPAWMYLVTGILLALFPLLVLVVFGAFNAILHPGGGLESDALLVFGVGAVLGLVGGIAGFVQERRKAAPRAGAFLRAPQGIASALVVALAAGMLLSSSLAAADHRALATAPASNVVPDETIQMTTTGVAFAPRAVDIPVGKLVALHITNDDKLLHTFSYHVGDEMRQSVIPPSSEVTLYFKFDAPQTIHFWCAPHSEGGSDTSESGMWGDLKVA